MIEYVKGDATQPIAKPAIIAHICNDVGAFGAGFVLAVSKRWSRPEKVYRTAKTLTLGHVQFVDVGNGITVANMIAQRGLSGPKPWVRYDALETCLKLVFAEAARTKASVHMPRIGCGIGGGSWSEVEPIIDRTCDSVRVVVYDYF